MGIRCRFRSSIRIRNCILGGVPHLVYTSLLVAKAWCPTKNGIVRHFQIMLHVRVIHRLLLSLTASKQTSAPFLPGPPLCLP